VCPFPPSCALPTNEFVTFLKTHKRYWLLPLVIFIAVLAAILFVAERRADLAPFVYGQRPAGLDETGKQA
jgi:hypothetical protein